MSRAEYEDRYGDMWVSLPVVEFEALHECARRAETLTEYGERLRHAVVEWDWALSSSCDGPERDAVRAAVSAWIEHRER